MDEEREGVRKWGSVHCVHVITSCVVCVHVVCVLCSESVFVLCSRSL